MSWRDGWPILGVNGKVPETLGMPLESLSATGLVSSDEFDEQSLPLAWQWNHNPDPDHSLSTRPGYLGLTNGRVDEGFLQSRNTLTQRTLWCT